MLGKPPTKYCFLIGQTLVMSSLYERHIADVITLWFLVLKCLHQFSCSSHQKQAHQVPSMIYSSKPRSKTFLLSYFSTLEGAALFQTPHRMQKI